jgi:hypothetical protein
MNFSEWIASSAGTGALLAGLVWIFRNWIMTRLKNAVGHEYNVKLESHKAELKTETDKQLLELKSRADVEFEKFRVRIGPYTEKQFERYNELWVALADLRHVMDDLWVSVNQADLNKFSDKLKKLHRNLEKSALLVEENHYQQLVRSLDVFMNYEIEKRTLINLRNHAGESYVPVVSEQIQQLISENQLHRSALNQAMQTLQDEMRNQLNGTR